MELKMSGKTALLMGCMNEHELDMLPFHIVRIMDMTATFLMRIVHSSCVCHESIQLYI